jgi:exosortase/archaeosortase family protein
VIYLTNIFRLAGLMFMEKYSSGNFFRFNHSYTYLILTYTIVFLLIIYYMRRLEPPLRKPSTA